MVQSMKMPIYVIVQIAVKHGYQKKKDSKIGMEIKKKNGRYLQSLVDFTFALWPDASLVTRGAYLLTLWIIVQFSDMVCLSFFKTMHRDFN